MRTLIEEWRIGSVLPAAVMAAVVTLAMPGCTTKDDGGGSGSAGDSGGGDAQAPAPAVIETVANEDGEETPAAPVIDIEAEIASARERWKGSEEDWKLYEQKNRARLEALRDNPPKPQLRDEPGRAAAGTIAPKGERRNAGPAAGTNQNQNAAADENAAPAVAPAPTDPDLQQRINEAQADAKRAELRGDTPAASDIGFTLEPERLELGEIPTGDSKTGTVRLTNTSNRAYTLLECKTSCGCTTANCQKGMVMEPGDFTEVDIRLDGGKQARLLSKTVTFLIEDHAPMRLVVSGDVVSYVVFEPATLDPEAHPDGTVTLTAIDEQPFRITSMYPPILTDLPTEPLTEHTLTLGWDAMKSEAPTARQVVLRTDHPSCNRVTVPLSPAYYRTAPALNGQTADGSPQAPNVATGLSTLDILLRDGKADKALTLIEAGRVSLTDTDTQGQTALHKAARWGSDPVIKVLVEQDAALEAADSMGRTPLMYAAQSKNVASVQSLLDAGADVHKTDMIGNTSLCWAAGFGNEEIVRALLAAGAKHDVTATMIGFTPLIWAAGFGEPGALSALLEQEGVDLDAADVLEGKSCLMHAVRTGRGDNAQLLLDAGANLEARDKEGHTPLLVACSNAGPDETMIELLVAAGADMTARLPGGESAIVLAKGRTDLRSTAVIDALRKAAKAKGVYDEEADDIVKP